MSEFKGSTHRRGFLGRLIAGAAGAIATGGGAVRAAAQTTPLQDVETTDDRWINSLKGKHRQIIDMPAFNNGYALRNARAYLNAYRDSYGLTDADVSLVIGVNAVAVALLFRDELWERYRLGEKANVVDSQTKLPSLRNPFLNPREGDPVPADASVTSLQKRGVLFLLCNNSLIRVVGDLAASAKKGSTEMRAELVAGLVPGVVIVPAMVVSIDRAQERGISYKFSG